MRIAVIAKIRSGPLVEHRQLHGLSQAEAAKQSGIHHRTWNALECMRFSQCSWGSVKKVAKFLAVSEEDICPSVLRYTNLGLTRIAFRETSAESLLTDGVRSRMLLPSPEEETLSKEEIERVHAGVNSLGWKEREIIKLRSGIGDGFQYTLKEIGQIFKITRERVRQIEAKAMRKLCELLQEEEVFESVA